MFVHIHNCLSNINSEHIFIYAYGIVLREFDPPQIQINKYQINTNFICHISTCTLKNLQE